MERTERLLDLIALFLDARAPVGWAELKEAFPDDYGRGNPGACERKFERDKAELAELGIALEYRPPSDDGTDGYVLSREAYYLPQIDLSPEETAVLYAAGSAALASGAFPGRADLAHALRKIAFASKDDPEALSPRLSVDFDSAPHDLGEKLEALWQALLSKKRVSLLYRGIGREEETRREVDPYGICLRRGTWVMEGFCHLRGGVRTFHVDRIASVTVNPKRPRTADYEVPAGFSISRVAREQVWQHRFHEPVEVILELGVGLAPLAPRLFPGGRVETQGAAARVTVEATYLDGLLRRVASLGDGARIESPPRASSRLRQMLERVERSHREKAGERVA